MNQQLAENQYGHGGLGHFLKPTDWLYHNLAPKGTAPFDWNKGYDVEQEMGQKIPVKNQGQSGSCGGQASAYYNEVLKFFASKQFKERSAKFIYSQVYCEGGGSIGGDLMSLMKNKGISTEVLCPSYQNGNAPTEDFMERVIDVLPAAYQDAVSSESSNYAFIIDFDIDILAQATRDNHGIIIGIQGQNNGTWLTQFPVNPTAPEGSSLLWGHWLYVGKAQMINGKKYIVVLNSWGDQIGVGGWQWISEDYVNSGYLELGMSAIFGAPKYTFSKDLFMGMTDADVYFLQKRLNQDTATMIATSGVGSPGNETYYFGSLTKNAVIRFQQKYGISPAVGYVGSITRGVLNK